MFRQRGAIGLAIRRVRGGAVVRGAAAAGRDGHAGGLGAASIPITGPTGTGKTTTIAATIGHINRTRRAHIVGRGPIEVVHDDQLSIVQQRHRHRHRLVRGRAPARDPSDPDATFIGEIRDSASALAAIQAAETGHLAISTLHTIDAMETIKRVLDLFPPEQQREIRSSFAGALRGIVSQRLVGRADGKGRVPVVEVLVNTGRVFDGSSIPTRPPASSRRSPTATSTGCRRSTKRS